MIFVARKMTCRIETNALPSLLIDLTVSSALFTYSDANRDGGKVDGMTLTRPMLLVFR